MIKAKPATTTAATATTAQNPSASRNNNHARASKQAMTNDEQIGGGNRGGKAAAASKLLRAGAAAVVLAACLAACGGSQQQKAAAPPKSDFERSLDTVRRGSYVKIYVIRRTDAQPLATEDKLFLRQNTPMETGMWVVTEDGRAAIAGAGFEFEPKHFEALSKRFTVEDYTNK
jgi:hypothetical protein